MDRVETLCDKLKEQIAEQATIDELLLTVQMLQSELQHLKSTDDISSKANAFAINIPSNYDENENPAEDKIYHVLDIDESEIEAELEEMKKIAETKNSLSLNNKRRFNFDPVEDIPTLSHQKYNPESAKQELNEAMADEGSDSLNDKLRESKKELSDTLKDAPIKDLKKAIGINDRFLYINELFKGDEVMYERSVKTINGFSIYPEAEYWIRRELKVKLGWDDQNQTVKQFDQLVKRRFSIT